MDLKVPNVGESVAEVQIGEWLKQEGDSVARDENLVVIESEKATIELPSPVAGILGRILKKRGETARVGEVIAQIESGKAGAAGKGGSRKSEGQPPQKAESSRSKKAPSIPRQPDQKPASEPVVMPSAKRLLAERGLKARDVQATGPGGRLLKEDVLRHSGEETSAGEPVRSEPETHASPGGDARQEEAVPMTLLRRTIARRLVQAQQTMAMLTTFNEADMSAVISLRREHQEAFQKRYGVKLGFMAFFVKACIDAARLYPALNAEVRGDDVVYRNYFDIGVAIGSGRGLVVPVLRNAERLSFAGIERAIGDLSRRAQESKLKPEELQGGTFTITNGGVYGSLLSTPIINPPQSGILGMHTIQERPVAVDGSVVIRPMMYLALTYDHRVVDGREAVTFLGRVKEAIENPARMLIEV